MKKYTKSSALKTTVKGLALAALAAALVVAGGWEERRELLRSEAQDTRLVTTILVFQCEDIRAIVLVPEHGSPIFHSANEPIPLEFYKDSILLSKNGVIKLTIPCQKKETLARVF